MAIKNLKKSKNCMHCGAIIKTIIIGKDEIVFDCETLDLSTEKEILKELNNSKSLIFRCFECGKVIEKRDWFFKNRRADMSKMQVVVYMPKNRKVHIDNVEKIEDLGPVIEIRHSDYWADRVSRFLKEEIINISINLFELED